MRKVTRSIQNILPLSKTLYLLLLFELSSVHQTRCWIGVIDQINPPWVVISKESGEQIEVPLGESEPNAQEGDWVIYWTKQKRLERLDSFGSRTESKQHQHWLDILTHPK
ncbi:MAG: hypothetical protein CMH49_04520 [Myxococcales bacterium]|nr:hypothetical protein [Myxococcales bacterium]